MHKKISGYLNYEEGMELNNRLNNSMDYTLQEKSLKNQQEGKHTCQ